MSSAQYGTHLMPTEIRASRAVVNPPDGVPSPIHVEREVFVARDGASGRVARYPTPRPASAMDRKAREYVECAWCIKRRSTPWERIDMDWFRAFKLVSTLHHAGRAIADKRDPALACRRIQTLDGHHSKFGAPFVCRLQGDVIAIAAHDVAFVAVPKGRKLVIITTLPRNTFSGSFNDFVKKRTRRFRRQTPRPAKGRNVNKPRRR